MQRTDLNADVRMVKFTIPYTDLTGIASTTTNVTLMTLPQGAMVLGCRSKHTTAFAGAGITDMGFTVGTVATPTLFAADLDIDAAVADTTLIQANGPTASVGHAAVTVIAAVTATGANLTALTAGSVDVYIVYTQMLTPNA